METMKWITSFSRENSETEIAWGRSKMAEQPVSSSRATLIMGSERKLRVPTSAELVGTELVGAEYVGAEYVWDEWPRLRGRFERCKSREGTTGQFMIRLQ
jgi:hypothetical protein